MANQQDQDKSVLTMLLFASFLVLVFHLYFFCYDSLADFKITFTFLDNFLLKLDHKLHLFSNTFYSKIVTALLLFIYCFGNKPKKSLSITWNDVYKEAAWGIPFFFFNFFLLRLDFVDVDIRNLLYAGTSIFGYLKLLNAGTYIYRIINYNPNKDVYNDEKEQFMHETERITNPYSVNIPIDFKYQNKEQRGYVNVINPFRATLVLGTPGSGKSFAIINNYIRQFIEKGFTAYIYDFKFDDLSVIAYNYYLANQSKYKVQPKFCTITFDDVRVSNRCNPIHPSLLPRIEDAQESAKAIMLNMNRTWIKKQGDFFVESPINYLAAIIWFLKLYDERYKEENGIGDDEDCFCTFPHAIELAGRSLDKVFPVLKAEMEIKNLMTPFVMALEKEAYDQLMGQIASAQIGLSRFSSKELYWVMTGNDFTLDLNNPEDPKILCIGNNPDRQEFYSTALGLYNSRILKIINSKRKLPCAVILDEFPTMYFKGIENLIATGRSNLIASTLGAQDKQQIIRDYGRDEAVAIFNTIGNVFAGQVRGETAKELSTMIGKNRQANISVSENSNDMNVSISDRMEQMVPESKIAQLSQGEFVGVTVDNFEQRSGQKSFKGFLVVEDEMKNFLKTMKSIPQRITKDQVSDAELKKMVQANYEKVSNDIDRILESELIRINGLSEFGSDTVQTPGNSTNSNGSAPEQTTQSVPVDDTSLNMTQNYQQEATQQPSYSKTAGIPDGFE